MTLSPGDIVSLNALSELAAPVGTDLLPILRASPMQYTPASALRDFVTNSVKYYGAAGDGVTDDTGAIQSAMNAGLPFHFPPGVYLTSATLVFNQIASHGQKVSGAGPTAADGSGPDKTIIRPGPGVSVAIAIDGTAFGGYVQGFALEDLTIDMANMADTAASVAILQGQAFDGAFRRVRIINDGANKRGFKFLAGAYVTRLDTCQCAYLEFAGSAANNRVTTIGVANCDIKGMSATWALNITFTGGTIQGPFNAGGVIWLAPGVSPYGYIPNTAGLYICPYVTVDSALHTSFVGTDFENGGGYPATFDDGVHGTANLVAGVLVTAGATNTVFINPGFEGCYLLDHGSRTRAFPYQLVWPDYDTTFKPLALCQSGVAQSIPSGVETAVDLGSYLPIVDDNTFAWDAVNLRLTVLQRGTCAVSGSAVLNGLTASGAQMRIRIQTSSGTFDSGFQAGYAAGYVGASVAFSLDFSPGDTIQLKVYQNSGAPIPLTGVTSDTYLSVAKL
ncbi:MAG TPA: glycosyl hydrolase family 28-related protein [Caulobacteraceae bacterium]